MMLEVYEQDQSGWLTLSYWTRAFMFSTKKFMPPISDNHMPFNFWALGRLARVRDDEDARRAVPEPREVSVCGEALGRLASAHGSDPRSTGLELDVGNPEQWLTSVGLLR